MAPEGAVAEAPVQPSQPAPSSAAPDPKSASSGPASPAPSPQEYKWEEDQRTRAQIKDLQNERKARQAHEREVAALRAQLEDERRKIGALTGLTKPTPQEADRDEVIQRMKELFPGLGDLDGITEIRSELEQQRVAAAKTHSLGMLNKIYDGIKAEYGDLTPSLKKQVDRLYFAANYNDPDIHARHNAGDPALVTEFVKEMLDTFVDPIKKKQAAADATRFRPVPGGRDRSTPVRGEKPKTRDRKSVV